MCKKCKKTKCICPATKCKTCGKAKCSCSPKKADPKKDDKPAFLQKKGKK